MSHCKWCGGEFHAAKTNQLYCTPSCSKKAKYQRFADRYVTKHKTVEPRCCVHCGFEFTPKRRDARFCSKDCNNKFHLNPTDDYIGDPNQWAVTTPYGAHAFDGWVAKCLTGAAHV